MALDLVDKRDLSPAELLSEDEERAIRAVADGAGGEGDAAVVLAVLSHARKAGHWLRCDCRQVDGRRPVVVPCLNDRGTGYWRVLGGRHPEHDEGCVFHRGHVRRRLEARWSRPSKAPRGYFAVLRDTPEDRRVARPRGRSEEETEERRVVRRPALSQNLLKLMELARFNRLPDADALGRSPNWLDLLHDSAAGIDIVPGRPLQDFWFPDVEMWNRRTVHARMREAAGGWPAGARPVQGFLCRLVWDVDAGGVGTAERGNRVEVAAGVRRPVIGRNAVSPPYLFLGVVGERDRRTGFECVAGFAQPIVASDCPVPVDSHFERRALGTLRTVLNRLGKAFPDAGFTLEKPVFDFDTPEGPCVPDFLIRARRGRDEAVFVVEVMGFDRANYLQGKEVTHPRMATLGTLCTMQSRAFEGGAEALRKEGAPDRGQDAHGAADAVGRPASDRTVVAGAAGCRAGCAAGNAPPHCAGSPGRRREGTHGAGVVQHLDLVARQLPEGEAQRDVGLAVIGAVLAAGGDLDHRPARVPDRDAAKRPRALAVLARTWFAARDAGRGRFALDAAPPGPPIGITLAPGGVFRLAVAAFGLGDGAGRAVGGAAEGRGLALDADPGGPAGVVAGAGGLAAGLALGRPVGRLAAAGAIAPGPPLGIAPAVGFPLRFEVSPFRAGAGARFAIGLAAGRRRRAVDAHPGGAAFGMAVALRLPPVLAAWLAHRPALRRRDMAAADAEAGGLAGLAAPAAALPAGAAPGLRIAPAIRDALDLRPGVTGAIAGAVLLGAGLAGRALRARRRAAALRADASRLALRVQLAAPLALVTLRLGRIPARLAFGAKPGVAGAARRVAPLVAGRAQAALRQRLGLAAPGAQAGLDARGGALGGSLAVFRLSD